MKNKRFKNKEEAIDTITRNGGKVGVFKISMTNPGLKVLGAIDYLVNFHGFAWIKAQ